MGDIITNPPTTPNTVSDSWQPLVDRDTMSYFGKNKITLTNWDATTTAPAIAQGSTIDIDGSIARFTADEAIGGAPADGTVYLMFVVSGSTVTAEWTAEAPTWTANKGGWYTAAGNRCSGHLVSKSGTVYTNKYYLLADKQSSILVQGPSGLELNITISDGQVRVTNPLEYRSNPFQYTKLLEFELPYIGTYRAKWGWRSESGARTVYSRLYKNGAAISAQYTTSSTSVVQVDAGAYSGVIGDTFELWGYSSNSDNDIIISDYSLYAGWPYNDFTFRLAFGNVE